MKLTFNPWKTVGTGVKTTSGVMTNTTPLPKDFNFHSRCHLHWWHMGNKKTSKNNHHTFINNFLTQASNINPTITICKFFSKDHIPPCIPTPRYRNLSNYLLTMATCAITSRAVYLTAPLMSQLCFTLATWWSS